MIVTFHNVQLSLDAPDTRAAYDALCNMLNAAGATDWHTDTYSVDDGEQRDTEELFPVADAEVQS